MFDGGGNYCRILYDVDVLYYKNFQMQVSEREIFNRN